MLAHPVPIPICPVHRGEAVLVAGTRVYGRRGVGSAVWICPVAGCDQRVGAHADGRPLGTLADAELRAWRRRVHVEFDTWWPRHFDRRRDAYAWLAMELDLGAVHVAELGVTECARIVALVERRRHEEARRLRPAEGRP